jgi:hypothetical protein
MRRSTRILGVGAVATSLLVLAACSEPSASGATLRPLGSAATSPSPSPTAAATTSAPASPTPSAVRIAAATVGRPSLGVGASLHGRRPFPATNAWNTAVNKAAVDPRSKALIASIGVGDHLHPDFGADYDGGPFGIPYVVVGGKQRRVPVSFDYADESDRGPYPIPASAPIEGGAGSAGDRHVLVVDRDDWKLYELYAAYPKGGGASWTAGSGAVFDLGTSRSRPAGWTSADAAGLPVFPGLVRYDEVSAGRISHALRFTVNRTRKAYVAPARHFASSATSINLPPMGMRVRLKASFQIGSYPKQARVVLQAMKTYGMIVADNGSDWYFSGAPDKRWNDDALNTLKRVPGNAFEVVRMGKVNTH